MQELDKDEVQKTEAGFGERVSEARREKGWTQREFAAKLDLDASAVSRLEKGNRAVRLGEAAIIARVLNVNLDALVYGSLNPAELLRRQRMLADEMTRETRSAAVEMVLTYLSIVELLEENPDLFDALEDVHIFPRTVDQYLASVLERVNSSMGRPEQRNRIVTEDSKRAAQLSELVHAAVHKVISTEPFPSERQLADHEIASRSRHPAYQAAFRKIMEGDDAPEA